MYHFGSGDAGHYAAYCCIGGDSWLHMSDASVENASLAEVLRAQAYLLLYERVV